MSRSDVAAQQAELLRALLADGPAPPGFDPARLRIEADVLRRKHGRLIAYQNPDLADALGTRFMPLFLEFTTARPKTSGVRSREYAAAFVSWLVDAGHLPRPRRRLFGFGRKP